MSTNKRFVLNEARFIVDTLNPANSGYCHEGDPEDDRFLRECVLGSCLNRIIAKLIINLRPVQHFSGGEYQPPNEECNAIICAIFNAIKASHLNSFDPTLSIQHKFGGVLKRKKEGMQDLTSLSLFRDDVENLLRDLYGDIESEALEGVLHTVFSILEAFTKYVRTDLWKEHDDAEKLDYMLGIGVPKAFGPLSGSEWSRGMVAKLDLIVRACEAHANPSILSEYTVEFAKQFGEHWKLPDNPTEFLGLSDEMKMRWLMGPDTPARDEMLQRLAENALAASL